MIQVQNKMRVYEVDGKDVVSFEEQTLTIESHWNQPNFVVIKIGDHALTVSGKDAIIAINNAMNTNRYG